MSVFIFLKTIADMFYAISALDYAMMAFGSILFVYSTRWIKTLHNEDYFAIAYMILLFLTLLRSGTGFNHFVKMVSGFMLYFIGRACYKETAKVEKALVIGNGIVVFANLLMFVFGVGFVVWGNASTFRGLYYYKTDFSIAMIYAIAAFMFFANPEIKLASIEWLVISYLIIRSNTRAALLILILLFGLWVLYLRERRSGKRLRINIKYVLSLSIGLVAAIFIVIQILQLPAFEKYHFISFNIRKLGDLFNASNTQGRNVIWEYVLSNYRRASWVQKAIGIDFVSDYWNGLDAHNAYLKILFSTGYIGLTVFAGFLVSYILRLNKMRDRSLFYYDLAILITFIVQSMSQSSIDFTQMTWVFMFFAGCAVSESYEENSTEYRFNKRLRLKLDWKK